MVNVTKLYPSHDATAFYAFGRVISGTCKLCLHLIFFNECVMYIEISTGILL